MAVPAIEVEVLDRGIVAEGPTQEGFALNCYKRNGVWPIRAGFGQLTQFDTSLGAPVHTDGYLNTEWGLLELLGAKAVETNFGHTQVISVWTARCYTGEAFANLDAHDPKIRDLYIVHVYDVDDGSHWEQPLHVYTSTLSGDDAATPMYANHAVYESCQQDEYSTYDFERWIRPVNPEPFYFSVFRGSVLFGNADVGCWLYSPSIFPTGRARNRQVSSGRHKGYAGAYGESGIIQPLVLTPGLGAFRTGYEHLDQERATVPDLVFASQSMARLVYVTDRTVQFSDEGDIAAISAGNAFTFASDKPITAVAELAGALYFFTEDHTYYWAPERGQALVVPGRLVTLSETVGCSAQSLVCVASQQLVWADRNGVHYTTGNLLVTKLSKDVECFFSDKLTNPLTHYYEQLGQIDTSRLQATSEYQFQADRAHLVYYPEIEQLLLVQPEQDIALVYGDGEWALWSWESALMFQITAPGFGGPNEITPLAGATRHIECPWLTATADRLFLVGGPDTQQMLPQSDSGAAWDEVTSRSGYVLEYGVGGALDRNIDNRRMRGGEDERRILSWLDYVDTSEANGRFYVGRPIKLDNGYVYQQSPDQTACPIGPDNTRYEDFLFPVYFAPEYLAVAPFLPVTGFDLWINFDNTHWQPVCRTMDPGVSLVDSEIALVFPPERIWSILGYSISLGGAPNPANNRQAQVWNTGTGLPDPDGNQMRLEFNGDFSPVAWTCWPMIELTLAHANLLFYIPMRRRRAADGSQDVSAMPDFRLPALFTPTTYTVGHVSIWGVGCSFYRESQMFLQAQDDSAGQVLTGFTDHGPRRKDNVAQPVDWAYASPNIDAGKKPGKVKLRGVKVKVRSSGKGTELDSGDQGWGSWTAGLLNFLHGADYKAGLSQVVDYSPEEWVVWSAENPTQVQLVSDKEGRRIRYYALRLASYGIVTYGDPANAAQDAVLIGNDEVVDMQVSDSVRGKTVNVLLFGHMRNKASEVVLESVKPLLRVQGQVGRTGRSL